MDKWGDGRKVKLWEWIVQVRPLSSSSAIRSFHCLVEDCEISKRWAQAGVYLEKVSRTMSKKSGGWGGENGELFRRRDAYLKRTAAYFDPDARETHAPPD